MGIPYGSGNALCETFAGICLDYICFRPRACLKISACFTHLPGREWTVSYSWQILHLHLPEWYKSASCCLNSSVYLRGFLFCFVPVILAALTWYSYAAVLFSGFSNTASVTRMRLPRLFSLAIPNNAHALHTEDLFLHGFFSQSTPLAFPVCPIQPITSPFLHFWW